MQGSKYAVVAVQNCGDFRLEGIQYDGEEIVWEPREVKHLRVDVATHCLKKSAVRWDPITNEAIRVLVEVRPGDSEPPVLSYAEGHPDQLLVTDNMPDTSFDAEGRPLPRGELKRLATPTAMMRGRIPGGANAGVPSARGPSGSGLGAAEPLPQAISDRMAERADEFVAEDASA